jgi:hypothetical protein
MTDTAGIAGSSPSDLLLVSCAKEGERSKSKTVGRIAILLNMAKKIASAEYSARAILSD